MENIYKRHRFLDAYQESAEYWINSTPIDDLADEEFIFAARLASRLGGGRLSRHLYRKARERAPELPVVRYFTRHLNRNRNFLLDQLLEFEKNPELGGDDNDLRASSRAHRAYTYAALRDFAHARELLKRAHEIVTILWIFVMIGMSRGSSGYNARTQGPKRHHSHGE